MQRSGPYSVMIAQATITFKWNAWAKRYLIAEGVVYLTWLIGFQIFVLLFQVGFAVDLSVQHGTSCDMCVHAEM